MKKNLFLIGTLFCGTILFSQQTADFENPVLTSESSWHGQDQVIDGDTIYHNGSLNFENNYNSAWSSYSGWAYSNITDNSVGGYANQFSAITGEGENSSAQYGICYVSNFGNNRIFQTTYVEFDGMFVTNTSYAYFSMLDGDAFGKQFGSTTNAAGDDDGTNGEDWFLLTIYGLDNDSLRTGDSINFYLADYRFTDDNDDYIIDEWTWVDLSPLGMVKGLDFVLSSSDMGGFGMNTPSYFAADNIKTKSSVGIDKNLTNQIQVYPNPFQESITLNINYSGEVNLHDLSGKIIQTIYLNETNFTWNLSDLEKGIYFISYQENGIYSTEKIIKY